MISIKQLENLPRTQETLSKYCIGQKRNIDHSTKKQLFYIGSQTNAKTSIKEQLIADGYDKQEIQTMSISQVYLADDIATILDSDLEDRNYHRISNLFSDVLHAINTIQANLSDKQQCLLLCNLYENMFR